ncbi:unnamed protein product [Camellia sinensis]
MPHQHPHCHRQYLLQHHHHHLYHHQRLLQHHHYHLRPHHRHHQYLLQHHHHHQQLPLFHHHNQYPRHHLYHHQHLPLFHHHHHHRQYPANTTTTTYAEGRGGEGRRGEGREGGREGGRRGEGAVSLFFSSRYFFSLKETGQSFLILLLCRTTNRLHLPKPMFSNQSFLTFPSPTTYLHIYCFQNLS